MSIDSALSQSLTVRLALQVSVSALPFVEEWMDVKLSEWLDSVPLPPEMGGRSAQFLVSVGSDLSRLRWSAGGHPRGYIPKLAEYLERAKVSKEELERINVLGEALEPEMIGSWVEVRGGSVYTGWQLLDREDAGEVLGLLGDEAGDVAKAVNDTGLLSCTRVARQIDGGYQLDFELTGAPAEDALAAAAPVLAAMGCPLELPEGEFVDRDLAQTRVVAVIGDAAPGRAGVRFGTASDMAASVASAMSVSYSPELAKIRNTLQSEGVVGASVWGGSPEGTLIDVDFVPATQRGEPKSAN